MKILIVSNLFPPYFIGGYEIAAKDTADILAERGYRCVVLTSDFVNAQPASSPSAYPIHRTLKLHYSWEPLRVKGLPVPEVEAHNDREVRRTLAAEAPDVVYFWNVFGLGVSPLKAVRRARIPATMHLMDVVLTGYDLTLANLRKKWRGESDYPLCRLGRYVRRAVSCSRYVAEHFRGVGAEASEIVPPFVDVPDTVTLKQRYELGSPIRGVYLGRIDAHKGVEVLCQALARINRDTGWRIALDLYGRSGTGLDERLTAQHGDFVRVISSTPRREILERLSGYDIGFFPSTFEEPFGVAQIELMYAGLPVISSGRGGSGEALSPDNAIRFEAASVDDLYAKTTRLIREYPRLAPTLGAQAARDVRDRFNKAAYAARIEAHLRRMERARP
jgi:glycogen(starch) synthase